MERRTLLAIILSILVLVFFQWISQKTQPPPKPTLPPEVEVAAPQPIPTPEEEPEGKPEEPLTADMLQDTQLRSVAVETDLFSISFTNQGGRIFSWKLKNYNDDENQPLELVFKRMRNMGFLPLEIFIEGEKELSRKINNALFICDKNELLLTTGSTLRKEGQITFRYGDGKGLLVEKTFTFFPQSYLVQLQLKVTPVEIFQKGYILLGPNLGNRTDGGRRGFFGGAYRGIVQSVINADNKIQRVKKLSSPLSQGEMEYQLFLGNIQWVGMEDNYFMATFIPADQIKEAIVLTRETPLPGERGSPQVFTSMMAGVSLGNFTDQGKLYIGPKDYELLSELGMGLKYVINFGFFGFIGKPMFYALKFFYRYIHNYGVAIIILTVLIKLLFWPLTRKSFYSMKKMQELQPKMKAVRDKYKKYKQDPAIRQKMNQEIMSLYRQEGVSPMGGCLPMLLQMPVLWAIYSLLMVSIEIRQAPFFGWIQDLSRKDPYYITPIVMGITMLIQQRMTPTTGDPAQARMFKLMPIFFTFLFLSFPSGLVLYWLVNNLLTIGQQHLINIKEEQKSPKSRRSSQKGKKQISQKRRRRR
ncbi:MAG: membrane protein insertase YidC [Acidobacteriota bacterium]